jgi:hypothetical protein
MNLQAVPDSRHGAAEAAILVFRPERGGVVPTNCCRNRRQARQSRVNERCWCCFAYWNAQQNANDYNNQRSYEDDSAAGF